MRSIEILGENEVTDKQARNQALQLWLKTRGLAVMKLLRIGPKNRRIKISRLFDNPVFVRPFQGIMHNQQISIIVQIGWQPRGSDLGGQMHSDVRNESRDFTIELLMTKKDNDGSIVCNEANLAAFLDERFKLVFLHECIHVLDELRYDDQEAATKRQRRLDTYRQTGPKRLDYMKAYWNTSYENNAFYHETVAAYLSALRQRTLPMPQSAADLIKQITTMPWLRTSNTVGQIMAHFSTAQRRSWLRRMTSLYTTRFAAG